MQNAKPAPTLLPMSTRLMYRDSPFTNEEKELNGKIPYASFIGSIMYTMVATRSDPAYVVGAVNRYMSNQGNKHWEVIKHIFMYLRGTEDVRLTFGSANSTEVKGCTDSDYAGNPNK